MSPTAGRRKPILSPTKISTFLECAVKYRYIYQDKIGKYYLHSRPGFSFGSSLHAVLQQFHAEGATATADGMAAGLEQRWISAGYETAQQEAEHKAAAAEIVQAYHTAYENKALKPVETVATEKTISCDMGRFILSGRVDRIDRYADGSLEVVDYKSGRQDVSVEEVAGSLAMSCYQLVLKRLYPELAVRGTIYCLRSGMEATYELTGQSLDAFTADILEIGDRILDTDWESVRPVRIDICPDCDFLSRCQFYWRQQARLNVDIDSPHFDDG